MRISRLTSFVRGSGRRVASFAGTGALLLATFGIPAPASAGTEVVAGWEGTDTSDFAFVAPMFGIPAGDGTEVVIKPSANYLRYESRDAAGTTAVRAAGASVGVTYRLRGPVVTFEVGPSLEYTHERRTSPSGLKSSKDKVGVSVGGNLFVQADRNTTISALANYSQTSRYFWSRGGVKVRVSNRDYSGSAGFALGPEVTFQTGHGVNQYSVGGMGEISFDKSAFSFQVHGGYSRSDFADGSHNNSPYVGAGLYHRF